MSNCYTAITLNLIRSDLFLSKLSRGTFAGYAMAQIKKARGLNKKILNPVEQQRKGVLDFCFVTYAQGATPVKEWLTIRGWRQENCGLVNVPHIKKLYALFYDDKDGKPNFNGLLRKENSEDLALSSVPEGLALTAYLSFNKDGYSSYCRDYREYWEWVEKRNQERYENTLQHGKNYDAKNMMHTIRLLDMADEIATQKRVIVRPTGISSCASVGENWATKNCCPWQRIKSARSKPTSPNWTYPSSPTSRR